MTSTVPETAEPQGQDNVLKLQAFRKIRIMHHLRSSLLEGVTSACAGPADKTYFDDLRDRVRKRGRVPTRTASIANNAVPSSPPASLEPSGHPQPKATRCPAPKPTPGEKRVQNWISERTGPRFIMIGPATRTEVTGRTADEQRDRCQNGH